MPILIGVAEECSKSVADLVLIYYSPTSAIRLGLRIKKIHKRTNNVGCSDQYHPTKFLFSGIQFYDQALQQHPHPEKPAHAYRYIDGHLNVINI